MEITMTTNHEDRKGMKLHIDMDIPDGTQIYNLSFFKEKVLEALALDKAAYGNELETRSPHE